MSQARAGRRFEFRIDIGAPCAFVWEHLQDSRLRPAWDERVVSYDPIQPGPTAKGSRFRVAFKVFGLASLVELECITWSPPHHSAVRAVRFGRGSLFAAQGGSWQLKAKDGEVTEWISRIHMEARGPARIARAVERAAGDYLAWLAEKSQESFRQLVEARWRERVQGAEGFVRRAPAPAAIIYESEG